MREFDARTVEPRPRGTLWFGLVLSTTLAAIGLCMLLAGAIQLLADLGARNMLGISADTFLLLGGAVTWALGAVLINRVTYFIKKKG